MEKASGAEKTQGLSKVCTKCGAEKLLTEFHFRKDTQKYRNECKQCKRTIDLEYAKKNKEKISTYQKSYYNENAEYVKERQRSYRKNDPEKIRKRRRDHYKKNKARYIELARKRELKQRFVTPKWADKDGIEFFYACCPEGYEVDHIIPIQGKKVTGLHTLENLQYLTPYENSAKSNKFEV